MLLARERDPLSGPVDLTERAVIGDDLRSPVVWCELAPCISWHGDPAALGEADIRARAIASGWRVDAFGRLVCLACQRRDPRFRVTHPVVVWDRRAAVSQAALLAVAWQQEHAPGKALAGTADFLPALPATVAPPYPRWHAGSRARSRQRTPVAPATSLNGQPPAPAHASRGRHRRKP